MAPLRGGLAVALERADVFGLVAVVVGLEVLLRVAAATVHPTLALLVPPVIAVPVLVAAAPAVPTGGGTGKRIRVLGFSSGPNDLRLLSRIRTVGGRALAAGVVGHVVALGVGTAAFLLVDTPIRYAAYASGESVPLLAVYVAPLYGVGLGTLLGWSLIGPGVARFGRGSSAREAVADVVSRPVAAPRTTSGAVVATLVAGGLVGLAVLAAFALAAPGGVDSIEDGVPLVVVAGLVGGPVAAILFPLVYPLLVRAGAVRTSPGAVPVLRVAVVVLLVGGLVVGAAGVRLTETRPMHASPQPLPDDATAAYATALENTERAGANVTLVETDGDLRYTLVLDRRDRQASVVARFGGGPQRVHFGPGTLASDQGLPRHVVDVPVELGRRQAGDWGVVAHPSYFDLVAGEDRLIAGGLVLPRPGTGEWHVVERANGTLVLELTDPDAVFRAVSVENVPENVSYDAAWVRIRIDADRGVVTGGRARLNATWDGEYVDTSQRYVVRSGPDVDVRYPAPAGPGLREWVWRLFAY